jgi:hypothetical protein
VRHHLAKLTLQFESGILTLEVQNHLNPRVVTREKHELVEMIDISVVAYRTKGNESLYGHHGHLKLIDARYQCWAEFLAQTWFLISVNHEN